MPKTIIFDFDGTLVNSRAAVIAIYNEMAEQHRFRKIREEQIEELRTLSIADRFKYLGVAMYRLPMLALEFTRRYGRAVSQLKLVSGIEEVVQSLHTDGYHLAIISSNSEKNIRQFLSANHILVFDSIYCNHNLFGKDKVIARFMKQYGLKREETLYVGDEQRDITACKNIGISIVSVTWGFDDVQLLKGENPDFLIHEPKEILDTCHSYFRS